jgi:hypothetical protein
VVKIWHPHFEEGLHEAQNTPADAGYMARARGFVWRERRMQRLLVHVLAYRRSLS